AEVHRDGRPGQAAAAEVVRSGEDAGAARDRREVGHGARAAAGDRSVGGDVDVAADGQLGVRAEKDEVVDDDVRAHTDAVASEETRTGIYLYVRALARQFIHHGTVPKVSEEWRDRRLWK